MLSSKTPLNERKPISKHPLYKKYRRQFKCRKAFGDDIYSWAIFQGSHCCISGLGHGEIDYYRNRLIIKQMQADEINLEGY